MPKETGIWDSFTNKYSVNKTLRFELKPVGHTGSLIRKITDEKDFDSPLSALIQEDSVRAVQYEKVKNHIDKLHRDFLSFALDAKRIPKQKKIEMQELIKRFYALYEKDKRDQKIFPVQRELAKTLTKILDGNAPAFLAGLAPQKKSIDESITKTQTKLKALGIERKSLVEKIQQTAKDEKKQLATLRAAREKLDKTIKRQEHAKKEYNKIAKFKFEKSAKLYDKTEELFTLTRLFYALDESATESISEFDRFHTYFVGFNDNRKNVYDIEGDGQNGNWHFLATSIANRLFEQNIKFYFDNIEKWKKILASIKEKDNRKKMRDVKWDWGAKIQELENKLSFKIKELFKPENFFHYLSQEKIDEYNMIRGGVPALEGSPKTQGLNEIINLTAQQLAAPRSQFPALHELYKQILSERDNSFIDEFADNQELIKAIDAFVQNEEESLSLTQNGNREQGIPSFAALLAGLKDNRDEIYISKEKLRYFSIDLTGSWSALEEWYLAGLPTEKEKQKQRKRKVYTVAEIEASLNETREAVQVDETAKKAEASDFYTQWIRSADKDNRPWLAETEIDPQNIFFSYFLAKFQYLLAERNEDVADYQKHSSKLSKIKEALHQDQKIFVKEYLAASQNIFRFFKSLTIREKQEFAGEDKMAEQNNEWKDAIEHYIAKNSISRLYNKSRNFLTKRSFSEKKFKLNFENPTLADGWAINKETENNAVLLIKNGLYYLAIMKKEFNTIFSFADDAKHKQETHNLKQKIAEQEESLQQKKAETKAYQKAFEKLQMLKHDLAECLLIKQRGESYDKVNYQFFKDATTMIPKCSTQLNVVKKHFETSKRPYILDDRDTKDPKFVKPLSISKEIFELNNMGYNQDTRKFVSLKESENTWKKKFQVAYKELSKDEKGFQDALAKWIGFCRDFCHSYKSTATAEYVYKDTFTRNYESLDQFYSQLNRCLYRISFSRVSELYIEKLINEEKLFLFQIYSKDFSAKRFKKRERHDNLHTMFWKSLFAKENLKDVVAKLDGQAEIFYRRASIRYSAKKREEGHHHKELVGSGKFEYSILKDKRYSEDKIMFHCPITLNFKQKGGQDHLNNEMNQFLRNQSKGVNIIGIDRGERNLLYYSVINQQGDILEQASWNQIDTGFREPIDYQQRLDKREKKRASARESWETIENIKELKAGYLSQVVHQLAKLIIKHNAIVVLEDLNFGFKRGRFKIEKQVYQKFERALINKLNYLVFKDLAANTTGHILKAYQLANKFTSFEKLGTQSGLLFYTAAAYTSKTDPISGYMRSLYPKYTTVEQAQEFFSKFDSIIYNGSHFEFAYNLKNLQGMTGSYDDKKEKGEAKLNQVWNQLWTIHSCVSRSRWLERKLSVVERDLPEYAGHKNGKWKSNQIYDVNQEFVKLFEKEGLPLEKGKDYRDEIADPSKALQYDASKFLAKLIAHFVRLLDMRVTDGSKALREKMGERIKRGKKEVIYRTVHNSESDFILSPVEPFYDSRKIKDGQLPKDSDANGAYNIARKGILILERIREAKIDATGKMKVHLSISKNDWQGYTQNAKIVASQRRRLKA